MNFWQRVLLNQAITTITALLQEGLLNEKVLKAIKGPCIRTRDLLNVVFPIEDWGPVLTSERAYKTIRNFKAR